MPIGDRRRNEMTDQEALMDWLWTARQKGQQQELLTQGISRGMSAEEALQMLSAPLPATGDLRIPTEASYNAWTRTGRIPPGLVYWEGDFGATVRSATLCPRPANW